MERVKVRSTKATTTTTNNPHPHPHPHPHPSHPADPHHHKGDKREKLHQRRKSPHPILHPDVAHAQSEGSSSSSVFRFSEDSRPMFSPVPRNTSDGEDSPRGVHSKSTSSKEKTSFPAIHVEKCEKGAYSYAEPSSPDHPGSHSPDSDLELDIEVMSTSQGSGGGSGGGNGGGGSRGGSGSGSGGGNGGGLNVPTPFLHRKSDGRVVLMTQGSNPGPSGPLTSWSRSEGNLPDAVLRASSSAPGSHSHLLDIRYRPDWQRCPTLRQSSDVALHELRRAGQRSPATPRRLPSRLEPLPRLSQGHRALSANSLQSP